MFDVRNIGVAYVDIFGGSSTEVTSFRCIRRRSAYVGCVSSQKNRLTSTGRSKITDTIKRESQNCSDVKARCMTPYD